MKKLIIHLTLFSILIISAVRLQAQPEPVDFAQVGDFFLKNDVKLVTGFNCWVVTTLPQFNKLLTPAKTAKAAPATPAFGNQQLIAVAMPPTMRKTTVIIEKIEMSGSILYVHCRVAYGENLTTKMQPLALATVERMSFIRTIAFYNSDNKMIKAISLATK